MQFIKSLGGGVAVVRIVKEKTGAAPKPQLFYNVGHVDSGIPWKYRPLLATVAEERGLPVPLNFLGGVSDAPAR